MKNLLDKLPIKPVVVIGIVWTLFLVFWLSLYLLGKAVVGNYGNLFGELPGFEVLENPQSEYTSHVYSADGESLGSYFRSNRTPVPYEKISKNMIHALVATEDVRFEEHSGIDMRGVLSIPLYLMVGKKKGASTITQQLAKNLFQMRREKVYQGSLYDTKFKMAVVKIKEWITAVNLERAYTKNEIMAMYLNTVDFGSNAFGIQVAAQTFFNKDQKNLDVHEAAMLTGLLKGPSFYSPINNYERCKNRRNTVLSQMEKYGYLSNDELKNFTEKELELDYVVENHNDGLAPYFRTVIRNYLIWWCKENGYDLFADGLKIYTTIDTKMQTYAENAVKKHLTKHQELFFKEWKNRNPWTYEDGGIYKEIPGFLNKEIKKTDVYKHYLALYDGDTIATMKEMNMKKSMKVFSWANQIDTTFSMMDSLKYYLHFLQTGMVSMVPETGEIKAWVGGIDHEFFKYDHVRQGKRQPGSTFKPIVYATILGESGGVYTPCFKAIDAPVTFYTGDPEHPTWSPGNSDGKFTGDTLTLRQALALSKNSVTAYMMKLMGDQTPVMVKRYAENLGITTPLEAVPAMCLGTFDISLYEMVGAYGTFANNGTYTKPYFISKIVDRFGNTIFEFPKQKKYVISKELAQTMIFMLRGATEERNGTAQGLRGRHPSLFDNGNQIAAKTGTTQNNSDGWFIGIVPGLVTGVWVGNEHRSIHFRSMDYGQGARMAMPIWAYYMEDVYKDKSLPVKPKRFDMNDAALGLDKKCNTKIITKDPGKQELTLPKHSKDEDLW